MRLLACLALAPLAGCATTPAGLLASEVDASYSSSKPSKDFALCVSETLGGQSELRSSGDHYWILRYNPDGLPLVRWDFTPTETGSLAEGRASWGSRGDDQVRACA